MEVIYDSKNFKYKNTVVTLGKFDGIHRGHRALIKKMGGFSGLKKVVFTFEQHPSMVKRTEGYEKNFHSIYSNAERRAVLSDLGVDLAVFYPFDKETMEMEAERFVKKVLVEQLDVKALIVGEDFQFGYRRQGNTELLKHLSERYGYELIVVEKKGLDDKENSGLKISSSMIRKALVSGNISLANEMLDAPYFVMGRVDRGKKLGRRIKSPTINVYPDSCKLLPPYGVYATETLIDGVSYKGVTDLGVRPTMEKDSLPRAECHLFDYDEEIYGKEVRISFLKFIRPEKRFSSLEELMEQIEKDKQHVREFFYE